MAALVIAVVPPSAVAQSLPSHAEEAVVSQEETVVQHVTLEPGWNRVGLYVQPASPAFPDVLGPALDDVVVVKDASGRVYSPRFGLSGIDTWNVGEGYAIFADTTVSFAVEGAAVRPEVTPLPLQAGWNLLPFYGLSDVPAEQALASIGESVVGVIAADGYAPEVGELDTLRSGRAYAVKLSRSDTLIFDVSSPNAAPVAQFTVACESLTCDFVDASTDTDGAVVSWSWTFGDGASADTGGTLTHTYAAGGTYTVRLVVADDDGDSTSFETDVTVEDDRRRFYGSEAVPWGPRSELYAPTYNGACPSGAVYDGQSCVGVEAWLQSQGYTSICTVDDDGRQSPDADAATIGGCGYAPDQATLVRAGTYRESVQPTAPRFALVAYPGERVVLSGADAGAPSVPVREKLFFPADVRGDKCNQSRTEDLLVAGIEFEHGNSDFQRFSICLGRARGRFVDNVVRDDRSGALDLDGVDHYVVGNRFLDNGVEGPGGTGSHRLYLAFNEVSGNGHRVATGGGHGGGGKFTRTHDAVIVRNVYRDNYQNGLWIDNAPFSNPFKNRRIVVAANYFDQNRSANIFIELFSDDVVISNNLCTENVLEPHEGPGNVRSMGCIKIVNSNGAVVAYNTVVNARNAALAIKSDNRSDWPVGETPTGCRSGNEGQRGYNEYGCDADGSPTRAREHHVYNNILMVPSTPSYTNSEGQRVAPRANAIWIGAVGSDDETSLVFRNNMAWNKGMEDDPQKATYRTETSDLWTDSYATWTDGLDARGGATFTSPLDVLQDTTTIEGMLSPAEGSPAVGAGAPVPQSVIDGYSGTPVAGAVAYWLTHDVWGRPRGSSPSVGAVEFRVGPQETP